MDACLTPVEKDSVRLPDDADTDVTRWVLRALGATICIGLTWRLARYLGQFPIWGDEAMLLLNVLDRDFVGLTHHLSHAQVAPLLFLWLEKAALFALGGSEWSVHLFPMLAGMLSVLIFWDACRRTMDPIAAGLAAAILAVSYYPVRHGSEVKPYAFDLYFSVLLTWLTLRLLQQPMQRRWLVMLALTTPLAVFSSYPSVFVAGAISVTLLFQMRGAGWTQRGLYVLFNFLLVGSFLVHYGLVAHEQIDVAEAERTRTFLRNYWKDAFPPETVLQWPLWLLNVFTGNMLAYPFGANHGGSTATFLLVIAGGFSMLRAGQRTLLALCLVPFLLNLLAAVLNKYPFGDSARITLHLAPFICLLMAHGAVFLLQRIPSSRRRAHILLGLYVLLFACGAAGFARDLMKPYKTEHDREIRAVVRRLAERVGPSEVVQMCHHGENEILAEMTWYLRTELSSLRWLAAPRVGAGTVPTWLVLCSHRETSASEVLAAAGPSFAAWKVVASEVRLIPPENAKMSAVYCHIVCVQPD